MEARKGDWVIIHNTVLTSDERAPQVPEDTRCVPLESWVKGFLEKNAVIGEEVIITTITGRKVSGKLVEINPSYRHNFGEFVPELLQIGIQLKEMLAGGENNA
ncbi:2-amino-4-oxopentanoate thiolase subunit OrtA [Geosporobacter ferrireducens]|uniref:2-amino-4-ketopentanoate thiolase n=1 Tax=Geosporobacter ferrireducens TaxID=1424294 RepID=A0A1D8GPQ1_9FIRM|nr:2-amino-4-oxopentanoate thiolase subunit OrtA [Geosporobacter ferrireducens]AOT72838.1 2-amino-4-ketopentanoate thiolase [Geosporobacter ferrireducens]MTI55237.1 2-amino-4-ketopentanoate thiolase [Geosporobacter ferrireducens]